MLLSIQSTAAISLYLHYAAFLFRMMILIIL